MLFRTSPQKQKQLACFAMAMFAIESLHAGMPSFQISEIAEFRLSSLSFFILVYLLSSYGMMKLWNGAREDFPILPSISYKRALGLVFLLGLAFHLILVMIAGTRELMSPEAWVRKGHMHEIAYEKKQTVDLSQLNIRRQHLEALYVILHAQEKKTGSYSFPKDQERWNAVDGTLYIYIPNVSERSPLQPIVIEPESFGDHRFVLLNNGMVEYLPYTSIKSLLKSAQ